MCQILKYNIKYSYISLIYIYIYYAKAKKKKDRYVPESSKST